MRDVALRAVEVEFVSLDHCLESVGLVYLTIVKLHDFQSHDLKELLLHVVPYYTMVSASIHRHMIRFWSASNIQSKLSEEVVIPQFID